VTNTQAYYAAEFVKVGKSFKYRRFHEFLSKTHLSDRHSGKNTFGQKTTYYLTDAMFGRNITLKAFHLVNSRLVNNFLFKLCVCRLNVCRSNGFRPKDKMNSFSKIGSDFFAGALIYRLFRSERKKKLKLLHAATMLTAFILVIIGLKAAFDSHNLHKVKKS
jgi:hypothetical protein